MHDEDNILMLNAKNGDKTAYETLVIKHRANAVSFAYGFTADLFEAEDIVQECFAKVYINRTDYKPLNNFKTYLFAVIRNACIDYLRQNKKSRYISLDDAAEISDNLSPEDSIVKSERITAIFKHFNSLPEDYKAALYLFAVDEMSYKQTAEIMQKSVPQVKIIIYRARKKLKKLCERDDIFEN